MKEGVWCRDMPVHPHYYFKPLVSHGAKRAENKETKRNVTTEYKKRD
jgi:hypothetical protein